MIGAGCTGVGRGGRGLGNGATSAHAVDAIEPTRSTTLAKIRPRIFGLLVLIVTRWNGSGILPLAPQRLLYRRQPRSEKTEPRFPTAERLGS